MAILKRPVLALNCGSSSLKFGLYRAEAGGADLVCEGEAEEIGQAGAAFCFEAKGGKRSEEKSGGLENHSAALERILRQLGECNTPRPVAVGHRMVHGGPKLREHQVVDAGVIADLEAAVEYAPLHMPAALGVLRAMREKMPDVAQVVCLDTAFHSGMPDVARTYALPEKIRRLGVERYGFHGLSVESVMDQLKPAPGRVVVAHLGNGASITAVKHGKSVDTTMGLTPTGGVMMGTRCGDLDPGIFVYLLRYGMKTAEEFEAAFDSESGLKGVSGLTNDVRTLEGTRKENAAADLALRMFCYQVRKAVSGMAAALGGVDLLVFTGGIGEHDGRVRGEIIEGLRFLGLSESQVKVLPAREDEQIAKIAARLMD